MLPFHQVTNVPAIEQGETISCKFVAKALTGNTWTCKSGPADEGDEAILANGEPVPQNVAAWMFPSFGCAFKVYKR